MNIIWCVVGGIVSGVAAGMGLGGGTLLIPVLTLLAGVGQHSAQCANMISFAVSAIGALYVHIKSGRISFKKCVPVILSGLIFAFAGAKLAVCINGNNLRKIFAVFLFAVAGFRLISRIFKSKENAESK